MLGISRGLSNVVTVTYRLNLIFGAALAIILIWACPAASEHYYVDGLTGDDSNQGTPTAPFRSFTRAVSILAPGDKLTVAGGRYTEPLVVTNSGTNQQPIVIAGDRRPLIEADNDAIVISASYVEVRGFEAHTLGLGSAVMVGKRNHHVRVTHNILRDSGCAGIAAIQTDYVTIENNRVFGNSRRSPWQCSGISIYQAINFDHSAGAHNFIRRNMVFDNMNVFVDNKISHSDGKTTDGNGIIIDDTRHTQGGTAEPVYDGLTVIENNIVFDNGGRGINVFISDHVLVRNNTNYHNLKDLNLAWRQGQGEFVAAYANDIKFINNISVPSDSTVYGFMDAQKDANNVCDYNLIEDGKMLAAQDYQKCGGRHNMFVPAGVDFVAPSVDPETADFHLRKGSPAIGTGTASDSPSEDFSGAPRPRSGPVDLGALQISGVADPKK